MKKLIALCLSLNLCFSTLVPIYAQENSQVSVVWGSPTKIDKDKIEISTSQPFEFSDFSVKITEKTLVIDAVTGNAITFDKILPNQPVYVYPRFQYQGSESIASVVIANIPQDFKVPELVTVKEIKPTGDYTGSITTMQEGKTYEVNENTLLNRVTYSDSAVITSIPKFNEIQEGMKLLIYTNTTGDLYKCILTPQKISEPLKQDISLEIKEKPTSAYIYSANGELYFPLRTVTEPFGYRIGWINDKNTATVDLNGRQIQLPIGNEHYMVDGSTYVSEMFLKHVLNLDITHLDKSVKINKSGAGYNKVLETKPENAKISAKPNNNKNNSDFLYKKGLEITMKIDKLAESTDFVEIFTGSDAIKKTAVDIASQDYKNPKAVYEIVGLEDSIFKSLSGQTDVKLNSEFKDILKGRFAGSVAPQINALNGAEFLATTSVLTLGDSFIYNGLDKQKTYLYLYDGKYSSMVTFIPFEDNIVELSANIVMNKSFENFKTADDVASFFENEMGLQGLTVSSVTK